MWQRAPFSFFVAMTFAFVGVVAWHTGVPETSASPVPRTIVVSSPPMPAAPEPSRTEGFELEFIGLYRCVGRAQPRNAMFRLKNTTDLTFSAKIARVIDADSGYVRYAAPDRGSRAASFSSDPRSCAFGDIRNLRPGHTAFTTLALGLDPMVAPYTAEAIIELCTSSDPAQRQCVTESVRFDVDPPGP